MTSFHKTIGFSALSENSMRHFEIMGKQIALYKSAGNIYATSDICTHEHCNLSDGFLEENIVECPCHGGKFDIKTGKVLALPPTTPLQTFKTKVVDGVIEIEI